MAKLKSHVLAEKMRPTLSKSDNQKESYYDFKLSAFGNFVKSDQC